MLSNSRVRWCSCLIPYISLLPYLLPSFPRPIHSATKSHCLIAKFLMSNSFVSPWTVCSPWGFSVHVISRARILEWVPISFLRGSSWCRDQTHISCGSGIARWILYQWAIRGFSAGCLVKNPPAKQETWVRSLGKEDSWRKWLLTSICLPEESHEQRSLAGYSPWGCKESDRTERLSMHTHV